MAGNWKYPCPDNTEYLHGDILESGCNFLTHQANCTNNSDGAKGLAKSIFERFPYSNIYSGHFPNRLPGNIIISYPPANTPGPAVVHVLGQRRPGGPTEDELGEVREVWFYEAMKQLFRFLRDDFVVREPREHDGLIRMAVPELIGCGLAGGMPDVYKSMIHEFGENCHQQVQAHTWIRVFKKKENKLPTKKKETGDPKAKQQGSPHLVRKLKMPRNPEENSFRSCSDMVLMELSEQIIEEINRRELKDQMAPSLDTVCEELIELLKEDTEKIVSSQKEAKELIDAIKSQGDRNSEVVSRVQMDTQELRAGQDMVVRILREIESKLGEKKCDASCYGNGGAAVSKEEK